MKRITYAGTMLFAAMVSAAPPAQVSRRG